MIKSIKESASNIAEHVTAAGQITTVAAGAGAISSWITANYSMLLIALTACGVLINAAGKYIEYKLMRQKIDGEE